MNGAARLTKEASPTPTSLHKRNSKPEISTSLRDGNKCSINFVQLKDFTYMRAIAMDQKLNENPQKATARVHTVIPIPMSLNGLTLQVYVNTRPRR